MDTSITFFKRKARYIISCFLGSRKFSRGKRVFFSILSFTAIVVLLSTYYQYSNPISGTNVLWERNNLDKRDIIYISDKYITNLRERISKNWLNNSLINRDNIRKIDDLYMAWVIKVTDPAVYYFIPSKCINPSVCLTIREEYIATSITKYP